MNIDTQRDQQLRVRKSSSLTRLFHIFSLREQTNAVPEEVRNEDAELMQCIMSAKMEWLDARMNFEHADSQEIVDYYTYKIKAGEVRYEYYLKKAKEKGIKGDVLDGLGILSNES